MPADEMLVIVQREWNGWRTAFVRVGDLQDIHWFQPIGAPTSLIHAYVHCDAVEGDIPHDCGSTPPPHRLLVCVLKSHATPAAYAEVARSADAARANDVVPGLVPNRHAASHRDGSRSTARSPLVGTSSQLR
jgi:hypothetical protein